MEDINSVVEDIKKYLKSDLVFGSKLNITDDLALIPIYKVKLSKIVIDSDSKSLIKGNSHTISLTPLCFIETNKGRVQVHSLNHEFDLEGMMREAPSILGDITKLFDIDSIIKKKPIN